MIFHSNSLGLDESPDPELLSEKMTGFTDPGPNQPEGERRSPSHLIPCDQMRPSAPLWARRGRLQAGADPACSPACGAGSGLQNCTQCWDRDGGSRFENQDPREAAVGPVLPAALPKASQALSVTREGLLGTSMTGIQRGKLCLRQIIQKIGS